MFRAWTHTLITASLIAFSGAANARAQEAFETRGTLVWHNFLSGPTAWNLDEYEHYIDEQADRGMNLIAFHCYTGGSRRYATYVEPMIRMSYRDVVPLAEWDTNLTARWGYRPLPTDQFAFDSSMLFRGHVFGSEAAVQARTLDEQYAMAQDLMRQVMRYARSAGMQVGVGFEFGVYPPEFHSVLPTGAMLQDPWLPDPTHPSATEILETTLDDLLRSYPDMDYIWLWLQELMPPGGKPVLTESFQKYAETHGAAFDNIKDPRQRVMGIWSQAFIQKAYDHLRDTAPHVRLVVSGWGGPHQLPPLIPGLDQSLPKEIIFSCLNPAQGRQPAPPELVKLEERQRWIIPWLEGDARLWHPQLRVSLLAEQIARASEDYIEGVIGIHWRTQDIGQNLDAFGSFLTVPPELEPGTSAEDLIPDMTRAFYRNWCNRRYGLEASEEIAPVLAEFDLNQLLEPEDGGILSPEYSPYDPSWGRLPIEAETRIRRFVETLAQLADAETRPEYKPNLLHLLNTYKFVLLLHEVGARLEPAYQLKNEMLSGKLAELNAADRIASAFSSLERAPMRDLFDTYCRRVRSPGELGVLSSLNQKLWLTALELRDFLEQRQMGQVPPPAEPDEPLSPLRTR